MAQIIKKHNKKITSTTDKSTNPACNCRIKTKCRLNGNCLQPSVIYQATTKSKDNLDKIYIGLTERPWKQRSYSHKFSFTNRRYAHSQALSEYLWDLKDKNQDIPEISWKTKKSTPAYSNNSKGRILCSEEKMAIITFPEQQKLLNKRSELISKCRHDNKFLLHNYDSKD